MSRKDISPSLEDYLEAILGVMEKNEKVRVTDLSEELDVAKSSVNQAVQKLMELGLVTHEKYGPLVLTATGKKQAEIVKRRHHHLKDFLINVLGVDNSTAEKDACAMEHHISAVTLEKLITFLEEGIRQSD
jgi:DtxR family Mn-dependent transcriptional regulator